MEYYSGSVSPEISRESSRMMYITWDVNQGLIFLVVYLEAKLEQFIIIQNLFKNHGNHLKTDAKTDK